MSRFASRWLAWQPDRGAETAASGSAKSAKSPPTGPFGTFGTSISGARAEQRDTFDPDAGEVAAVKLRGTVIGDLWLVADPEALVEHPDILRSGLAVFFFDEITALRGKSAAELQRIGMVKATFPTSRLLQ